MITLTPKVYADWIPLGQIYISPHIYAVAILPAGKNETISIGTERWVGLSQATAGGTKRKVGSSNTAAGGLAREVKATSILPADAVRCVSATETEAGSTKRQVARSEEVSIGTARQVYSQNVLAADTRRIVADGLIFFNPSVFARWIPLGKIVSRPMLYAAIIPPTEWQVSINFDAVRNVARPAAISGETERKITQSNTAIADTRRAVFSPYIAFAEAGTQRIVQATNQKKADTQRLTSDNYAVSRADTSRITAENFAVVCGETRREVEKSESILFDTSRKPAEAIAVLGDTSRTPGLLNAILLNLKRDIIKRERIAFDTSIRLPVVLKYTVAAPAARIMAKAKARTASSSLVENFHANGIRSFTVTLGELSLSDSFQIETSQPLNIDDAVQGRLLDYDFSFHVEETSQKDLIQTVKGMYNQDAMLYTAISIFVEEANVSYYAQEISRALGLKLHRRCDDFIPSQNYEDSGMTYRDFLSSLFGWTSKLPQRQINVFIRGDTLHIIQRGLEENVIDITDWPYERPTIDRKLVRSVWSSKNNDSSSNNSQAHSDEDTSPIPFTGNISFGGRTLYYSNGYLTRETTDEGYTTYTYDGEYLSEKRTHNKNGSTCLTQYTYVRTDRDIYLSEEYEKKTEPIDDDKLAEFGYAHNEYDWTDWNNENFTERITYHVPIGYGWYGTTVYVDGHLEGSTLSQGKPGGKASQFTIDQSNLSLGGHWKYYGAPIAEYTSLIDTEFPVKGDGYLWILTQAIEWLNRKTQETVSLVIHSPIRNGVPEITHVLDFTERIRFRGNEYFLVSNIVELTPRTLKQSVKMTRWY